MRSRPEPGSGVAAVTGTRSGADLLLEVLTTEGVRHIFGNPGTTELPLMDALSHQDAVQYVLGLHESVSVAMADGYAQATGRPSFVNLHTAPGLGNAMGSLANAWATRTPMVVTAGQQDQRHLLAEPFLSGDLTTMATGVVKWARQVSRVEDMATLLRRAFHDAAAPPAGPVFVAVPMDLLQARGELSAPPPSRIELRSVPEALGELAGMILDTPPGRFAIIAGDEVAHSGAVEALVEVARRLGCPVYGSPLHSTVVFPTGHRLWAGSLPADAAGQRGTLLALHTVLLIGSRGLMTFLYRDISAVPDGLRLLQLSPAAEDLGRSHPTALGLAGDPRATLEALAPMLGAVDAAEAARPTEHPAETSGGHCGDESDPMHPLAAVRAVLAALPPDSTVVDEGVTSDPYVRAFHQADNPGRFLYSRGGGLGWGLPAAMGVSLGRDRQPVVAITGDGSFLYSPQALWTAVRERLPVVDVVLNNGGYLILRRLLGAMADPPVPDGVTGDKSSGADGIGSAPAHSCRPDGFVGVDIVDPAVDLVALAHGFGADGVRVERLSDVTDAVRGALRAGRPCLVELPVASPPSDEPGLSRPT